MSAASTEVSLHNGLYTAHLSLPGIPADAPDLALQYLGEDLPDAHLVHLSDDKWRLEVPILSNLLSDGVHTLLLVGDQGTDLLHSHVIASGTALSQDMRAELALMRAELDLLKRAFRRKLPKTSPEFLARAQSCLG